MQFNGDMDSGNSTAMIRIKNRVMLEQASKLHRSLPKHEDFSFVFTDFSSFF